jgi:ubiquinone/menaquinone biosynthesis C-methylase UbiE
MLKQAFFLSRWHHVFWARKALGSLKGKLLDIGTGSGRLAHLIVKGRDNLQLVGLDIEKKKGWQVDIIADARDLPLENKEFDGVLILDVLEHVKEPEKVLAEAARVLKPRGVLHLTVPLEGAWWVLDYWLRKYKQIDWKKKTIGHINHFTLSEMRALLERNGLRLKWVRYSHHWFYQLGTLIYFRYLASLPKKQLKPDGDFWLPIPWAVRVGVVMFGWLTVLESWVLSRVPGREAHITTEKIC